MKDASIFILLVIVCILAVLFINEQSKHLPSISIVRDTVWVSDTIRPKQPKPIIIQGQRDTITQIDWAAIDSIKKIYGDSISTFLAQQFTLAYEDTIQKMSVTVNPILKQALFVPWYKPIVYRRPEVTTKLLSDRKWFEASLGTGYRNAKINPLYFFLDANININQQITITPRLSNEYVSAELRYRVF